MMMMMMMMTMRMKREVLSEPRDTCA